MQTKYGFFWLAKIFGCEPNGLAKKIPSASLEQELLEDLEDVHDRI